MVKKQMANLLLQSVSIWAILAQLGEIMSADDKKRCPEYCPFLKASNTYCELFRLSLQTSFGLPLKCEQCTNPVQRMESYKSLSLSVEDRVSMWQKAIFKHNEIELGKKRKEEKARQTFAAFLEEKYGARPPLEGNTFLKNLVINLYMVLDATERSMMMAVLNSNHGEGLLQAIDRAPRDESLLRNVRRELDAHYMQYHNTLQRAGFDQNTRR